MSDCAKCFHPRENHEEVNGTPNQICTRTIDCRCEKFEVQHLVEFAAEIEKHKLERWTQFDRCKWILEEIPQTRNAGEKTFAKIYNEIWFGFKIRKEGTSLTTEEFQRLPSADSINREKRRAKQLYPELATYSKEVLMHQTAIYNALMEMAAIEN